jgi:TolA-binding protein
MKSIKFFCFLGIFATIYLFSSCSESNKEVENSQATFDTNTLEGLKQQIAEYEKTLYSEEMTTYNQRVANLVLKAYEKYAISFPEDELTPDYLFKAGEVAVSLGLYGKAILNFRKIISDYQTYEKAGYAYFMIGFVNDQYLQDLDQAKIYYSEFVEKYPDHVMAKDAKIMIQNLGKSDEELIKEFEAKANS